MVEVGESPAEKISFLSFSPNSKLFGERQVTPAGAPAHTCSWMTGVVDWQGHTIESWF